MILGEHARGKIKALLYVPSDSAMAPKRAPEALRALAGDPVTGWAQTPLVKMVPTANVEALNAPYLASFLKHRELPASKAAKVGLNGVGI